MNTPPFFIFKTIFGSKRSYDEYMFKNQELAAQRQHGWFLLSFVLSVNFYITLRKRARFFQCDYGVIRIWGMFISGEVFTAGSFTVELPLYQR